MEKAVLKKYADDINAFYVDNKRMPSYSEMLGIFGLSSKNAVFKRVRALIEKGFLEKDKKGKILPKKLIKPLSVLGFITAGFPSPAEEELQDIMSLDEYLITNPRSTYLLKVEGDSMVGAGINAGDLVMVEKNRPIKTGDIVVAMVDNEWTLKYFEKRGKNIILKAANDKYPAIIPRQELIIAGVVVANVRKYK